MAKTGPKGPNIIFDDKQISQMQVLASMGASNESIAEFFDCSADTLERNYAGTLKKGKELVRNSLRLAQMTKALQGGNVTMMIWLGKQMLGQKDKVENFDAPDRREGFDFTCDGMENRQGTGT